MRIALLVAIFATAALPVRGQETPAETMLDEYARILRAIGSAPRAAEVAQQALTLKQGDVEMTMIYAQASLDIGKADDAAYALARAEAEGGQDWRLLSISGVTMDTLDQHGAAQDY